MGSVVEHFPNIYKTLCSVPSNEKKNKKTCCKFRIQRKIMIISRSLLGGWGMIRASFFIPNKSFFPSHCEVFPPCQILTQRATRAFICTTYLQLGPTQTPQTDLIPGATEKHPVSFCYREEAKLAFLSCVN